jgi:hypothetical protein
MRIDLHTHSTASDGTLTPAEVAAEAAAAGLDVVALTDHDGIAGWTEARRACAEHGLEFVPGVELSCRWYATQPALGLHLLAYYVDPDEPQLAAEMARVRDTRDHRGERIVELMRADGVDVTWEEVRSYAGGAPVGRPHIAQALIRRGLVDTVADAFAPSMLGQRWRLPKSDTDVFQALALVRQAGGVAVFAHPKASRRGRVVPDELIVELVAAGLAGLEVDHEDHTPEQREQLRQLAAQLDLVVTGSSDFHGANKAVRLGAYCTRPAAYERILALAGR